MRTLSTCWWWGKNAIRNLHTVLGKHPYVLIAQAPKIGCHEGFNYTSLCMRLPQIWSCPNKASLSSSGKSCIVLENGPTCGLVVKPPQSSSLAICKIHSVSEKCGRRGYERCLCEPLLPDVMASYAYWKDHGYMYTCVLAQQQYVRLCDEPTVTSQEFWTSLMRMLGSDQGSFISEHANFRIHAIKWLSSHR